MTPEQQAADLRATGRNFGSTSYPSLAKQLADAADTIDTLRAKLAEAEAEINRLRVEAGIRSGVGPIRPTPESAP